MEGGAGALSPTGSPGLESVFGLVGTDFMGELWFPEVGRGSGDHAVREALLR